jgi:catechol 2,3-dioxygenase
VGLYHFGLKVGDSDDELREALATLRAAGATVMGASDHTVTHSLYIADPDGNEIELYVDMPDVDWRSDPTLIAAPIKPLRLSCRSRFVTFLTFRGCFGSTENVEAGW